jgi:hypothetical protein
MSDEINVNPSPTQTRKVLRGTLLWAAAGVAAGAAWGSLRYAEGGAWGPVVAFALACGVAGAFAFLWKSGCGT